MRISHDYQTMKRQDSLSIKDLQTRLALLYGQLLCRKHARTKALKECAVVERVQRVSSGQPHLIASGHGVAVAGVPGRCKGVVEVALQAVHVAARAQIHDERLRIVAHHRHERRRGAALTGAGHRQVDRPVESAGAAAAGQTLVTRLQGHHTDCLCYDAPQMYLCLMWSFFV